MPDLDNENSKLITTIIESVESLKSQNLIMMESLTESVRVQNQKMIETITGQGKCTHDVINSYVNKTDMILDWIDEQKKRTLDFNGSLDSSTSQVKRFRSESDICQKDVFQSSTKVDKPVHF